MRSLLKSLIVIVIILILGVCSSSEVKAQTSDWQNVYGVEFAEPADFSDLRSRGVNTILSVVGTSQTSWDTYYQAAVSNNIKLIPMLWGSGQTIWTWNSNAAEWELSINRYPNSIGAQFLNFLRNNPADLNQTFAVYGFHEPFNPQNPGGMVSVDQQRRFWQQIHNEEFPGRQLNIYSEDISHACPNGCADYDHLTLYNFANCDGGIYRNLNSNGVGYSSCTNSQTEAINTSRAHLDWYYNNIHTANPAPDGTYTKLIALPQTFAMNYSNLWNRMPSAAEMYAWGTEIVGQRKARLAGMLWYPYRFGDLYHTKLYTHRFDSIGADRWAEITNVANFLLSGSLPTPTPTPPTGGSPTPTPTLRPPTPTSTTAPTPTPTSQPRSADVNNDGVVNSEDMNLVLRSYGGTGNCGMIYDCDLNNDNKVNSVDAAYVWQAMSAPITSTPAPTLPPGTSSLYGVKFAQATDYSEVAGYGVMNPVTVVNVSNPSDIVNAVNTSRNLRAIYPNFKPIFWQYPEGWTCSGGINDTGRSFINYLNSNSYWNDILAIYGLHEPLGTYWESGNCTSLTAVRDIHSQVKSLSGDRAKIFGKMYSDTSFRGFTSLIDGICDYCSVLYHPYRANPREYRRSQMLSDLERDTNLFKGLSPGITLNKFVPYLSTIEWSNSGVYGTGLYMPSPTEMRDGGSTILNFVSSRGYRPDGLVYYTWDDNSTWTGLDLYNADGQRNGRIQVISDLSTLSLTPTPIPTPAGIPGDANGDGVVDNSDYTIWLSHYNQVTSNGERDGDFNLSGRVDGVDYTIWRNNYGIGVTGTPMPTGVVTTTPTPTIAPTSTPVPTNTPTPTPASGVSIVLNSATGQTCRQVCASVDPNRYMECRSVGTYTQALNNGAIIYSGSCITLTSGMSCDSRMNNTGQICSGNQANWTRCRCE